MNSVEKNIQSNSPEQYWDNIDKWFTSFIDNLKVDHVMLQTGVASKETKEFYDAIVMNDTTKLMTSLRSGSSQYFIKSIVYDYINELKTTERKPLKLAFGLSDSKILIWSEINDNDEETENCLLLTEAKINSKYHSLGFYVNSTIIEKSDNVSVPPHYQTIIE